MGENRGVKSLVPLWLDFSLCLAPVSIPKLMLEETGEHLGNVKSPLTS